MALFDELLSKIDGRGAIFYKRNGKIESMPYPVLFHLAERLSKWLIKKGLKHGDRVGIFISNSPEWAVIDFACLKLGIITVPINMQNSEEHVKHIIDDSRMVLLFTQKKIDGLKTIKQILVESDRKCEEIFEQLEVPDDNTNTGTVKVKDRDIATICYTSGSTGKPKGVMISHESILFNIKNQPFKFDYRDKILSYLPLGHMFERSFGYYTQIYSNCSICFAESTQKVIENAKEFKPTIMLAVPKVLDNIYNKINDSAVARFLIKCGLSKLVGIKVNNTLGGRIRQMVCGGAPLDKNVLLFCKKLGLDIYEGYGLTEAAPLVSTNYPGNEIVGSVGKPLEGIEVNVDERGHLMIRSPGLFKDYTQPGEKEKRMTHGWFDTNDLAEIKEGYIYIKGRADDLIVLSNGKKVYPEPIEKYLESMGIGSVFLYGKGKPFISALVFSDKKDDLDSAMEKINSKLASYEKIRKYKIIDEKLSVENGLVTPIFKKVREKIVQKYKDEIEGMYDN